MSANMKRQERAKAAWVHERDPRYDPMTGDLLEPDEFPLDAKAEYYFDGKERPRRFIPPDSPHLNDYKPLETENEQEVSEGEYRDRLVNRLRKAGFVEVEPTLMDKVLYEKTRWFENLPPEAKIDFLQEALREVTQERLQNEDTAGEKFAQMIELVIEFVIALFKSTAEAEETPAKKAA
jgi:hypothetical protein